MSKTTPPIITYKEAKEREEEFLDNFGPKKRWQDCTSEEVQQDVYDAMKSLGMLKDNK